MARKRFSRREKPEYDQKLLELARVTRVVKGGRRFRFRATVVAGNRNGKVGVGVGKGTDVSESVRKAFNDARRNMIQVRRYNNTIACEANAKVGSAKVMIRPAKPGRGIVAGGAVRAVVEMAGIRDIVSKSLGSANKLSVARATVKALEQVKILSGRNS
ncbi:MAG: 30S ribosomal protein S5 [Patescibacteria group bacterium]|nr:30S ribosomal protein S5 [Patescibacteria group bacterium]